jgi:outer membrane protein assembly factor BamB
VLASSWAVDAAGPASSAGASGGASCARGHAGGDWPSFGHDAAHTSSQPLEHTITPSTAAMLRPRWRFSLADVGAAGDFHSTPVIAHGCLYIATNDDRILALDADTGRLVWKVNLATHPRNGSGLALSGGAFSLAVDGGRVFADVTHLGHPYAIALDARTGRVLWKTVATRDATAFTNASVSLMDGMVFMGISGPEDGPDHGRNAGGYAFIDERTGEVVEREYVVPPADDARGLKGVSIWATAAYDPSTGFAYVGTGQPANKDREHRLSNAIVKIDARRDRGNTFGRIVDAYRGDYDERGDLDFGGSPVLFRDRRGRELVGELQKSGRFHAAFADTMEQAWWTRLAAPEGLGNSGTPAFDGRSVFIAADTDYSSFSSSREPSPGYLFSLDRSTGAINWRVPVASGLDYHLIAVAGGVVYMVTTHGVLLGVDAALGLPVVARPLGLDTGDACANLSSGAVVARHQVYAVCDLGPNRGGSIVAYGL